MAFCKNCRAVATDESAFAAKHCRCCKCMDYILPGINAIDLVAYYTNRGRWDEAKAALLAASLDPVALNELHGALLDQRECASWVELNELLALSKKALHTEISERYNERIADWYCDAYLGGYEQRWQLANANAKANGLTG